MYTNIQNPLCNFVALIPLIPSFIKINVTVKKQFKQKMTDNDDQLGWRFGLVATRWPLST